MRMGPIAMIGTPTKEGTLDRETQRRHAWPKPCDSGGRNWSDASTNQGMPKIAGHHQRPGRGSKDPPREPLERTWPSQQLNFVHLASRTVREYISSVLTPTVFWWCVIAALENFIPSHHHGTPWSWPRCFIRLIYAVVQRRGSMD